MNINAMGVGAGQAASLQKPEGPVETPEAGSALNQTSKATETEKAQGREQRARGVLGLLQEGHFKGVADVRLRINFAEELSSIHHAGAAQAVEAGLPAVDDVVDEAIAGLIASGALDDEQTASVLLAQEEFSVAVQEAADEYANGTSPDTQGMLAKIQSAFDDLVADLNPTITALVSVEEGVPVAPSTAPEVEAELGAGPVPTGVDPAESPAPASAFETFIEELTAAFNNAVESFQTAVADANPLPELSKPTGNGVAYQRFVNLLNDMQTAQDKPETAGRTNPIDTVV